MGVILTPVFVDHSQLLEDVEDTLSCTAFEEDYLSRKLNCEYFTLYFHHVGFLFALDIFSFKGEWFFCVIVAGTASCWVKLNMEAMQKEYQAVHNKRLSLGETEPRSSTSRVSVNRFIITFLSTSSQKCVGRHRRGNGTWATHWPC